MENRVWHQHYDEAVPISIDYPQQSIPSFLSEQAAKNPDKKALIFGGMAPALGEQHSTMTYGELNRLADRFAAGLQRLGLKKGDRVAVYMPNAPQVVIAYYGILRAGGIVVPCNPLYVAREIEHQLQDSGARFALVLSALYPNVKEVRHNTPVEHVIVTNIKEYFPFMLKTLFTLAMEKKGGHAVDISGDANTIWFQDFLALASPTPTAVEIDSDDRAVLMYTGGTTGVPKGAELTHASCIANASQARVWIAGGGLSPTDEVMVTALPLTHSYAMTACLNLSVFNGYTQIIIPDPRNLPHLLTTISRHRATILPGVPTLYNAIINHPDVRSGKADLKSLKISVSGAAGLPLEVQKDFERVTGGKLIELYGLSEASPAVCANPLSTGGRNGSIGLPIPDTDAKIVDSDQLNKILGPEEPGELCVAGPQVMKGYWRKPEETSATLIPDETGKIWLHTGDIAMMSEDGYIRLVDRKKDMILAAGGFNVYPRDIEERLYEHPKIFEAAAIGVPVGGTDQRAKVFVVLHPGEQLSEQEVLDWCRDGLARYKVPKYVEFRTELPKSMVGKILRRELMDEEVANTTS